MAIIPQSSFTVAGRIASIQFYTSAMGSGTIYVSVHPALHEWNRNIEELSLSLFSYFVAFVHRHRRTATAATLVEPVQQRTHRHVPPISIPRAPNHVSTVPLFHDIKERCTTVFSSKLWHNGHSQRQVLDSIKSLLIHPWRWSIRQRWSGICLDSKAQWWRRKCHRMEQLIIDA